MRLLIDTHTFLWFVWDDSRLSAAAKGMIEDMANELLLSAASIWEMAIKVGTGKLSLGAELDIFLNDHMVKNGIQLLGISIPHVAAVSKLPPVHRDPFDRLIVAQSVVEGVPLVSADPLLESYGIQRLW